MSKQPNGFDENQHDGVQPQFEMTLSAVTDGEIIAIEDVPDNLFSQKMIGDGFAMKPQSEVVYAPIGGKLIEVADTKHAYYIETDEGLKVLVHIGIDTLLLNGEGFTAHVKKNMRIEKGEKLATFNRRFFEEKGFQSVIPVIVLEHPSLVSMEYVPAKDAKAKETTALKVTLKS